MEDPSNSPARNRRNRIILFIAVAFIAKGLGFACFWHFVVSPEPLPPEATSVKAEPFVSEPEPILRDAAAGTPAQGQRSQPPAVRHFTEHLSTDDVAAKDSIDGWRAGKPGPFTGLQATDTLDMSVFYYLPDGSIVEYDLASNRYRIFARDTQGLPLPVYPADPIDPIGGYRVKPRR